MECEVKNKGINKMMQTIFGVGYDLNAQAISALGKVATQTAKYAPTSALKSETMTNLKYYGTERAELADDYAKDLNREEAKIVCKKLAKHFKLRYSLHFRGRCGSGSCSRYGRINLGIPTNFGTICHEFAHLLEFTKYGHSRHARRHRRLVLRLISYCRRKMYWEAEIGKRLAPKPVKVSTEAELKDKLILKRQEQIARFEKRLSYLTKLYVGKIRKAKRSLAALQRSLNRVPKSSTM